MYEFKKVVIEGHKGTWYNVSDGRKFVINGKEEEIYIWEHEKYGFAVPHLIANRDGKLFMEHVWNGWWDWKEFVLLEQGYDRPDFPLIIEKVVSL